MTDEKNQEEPRAPAVRVGATKSQGDSNPTENRPKRKGGFNCLPPEERRRIASLGGLAAQQTKLAHRFTPEEARKAGQLGGAKISSNREHMREIGAKGGRAKKGYKLRQQPTEQSQGGEARADDATQG